MKLINKTQRYYLLFIIGLLIIWGIVFFFFISKELSESLDEDLNRELQATIENLQQQDLLPELFPGTPFIQIEPIQERRDSGIVFTDTLLVDPEDGELEPFREIATQVVLNGRPYRVVLRKSQFGYDDLLTSILYAQLVFIVLLTGIIAVFNRKFFGRIWHPFYHTINQLTSYNIRKKGGVSFKNTDIDEFRQLNAVIKGLLERIEEDYGRLKQFTENASHEIQTPLSVIRNQTELLFQDESLPRELLKRLKKIHAMAGKLARLNSALLLLTKIENDQYPSGTGINSTQLLERLVAEYHELASSKDIVLEANLDHDVFIDMNAGLAEMMFRNLLSNAVKHNYQGGTVEITLGKNEFMITNTGMILQADSTKLFDRFYKEHNGSDSLGLGLSIVHSIVKTNGFGISYTYKDRRHTVRLKFK